jgi:hypothetical protein
LLLTYAGQDKLTGVLKHLLGSALASSELWGFAQTEVEQLGSGNYHRRATAEATQLLMSRWGEGSQAVHYLTLVNGVEPSSSSSDLADVTEAFRKALQGEVREFRARQSTGSERVLVDASYDLFGGLQGRARLILLPKSLEVGAVGNGQHEGALPTLTLPRLVHLQTLTRQEASRRGNGGGGGLRLSYQT